MDDKPSDGTLSVLFLFFQEQIKATNVHEEEYVYEYR